MKLIGKNIVILIIAFGILGLLFVWLIPQLIGKISTTLQDIQQASKERQINEIKVRNFGKEENLQLFHQPEAFLELDYLIFPRIPLIQNSYSQTSLSRSWNQFRDFVNSPPSSPSISEHRYYHI